MTTDQKSTTLNLDAIEARAAAATAGPWRAVAWDDFSDSWLVVDDESQPDFYSAICEDVSQGRDRGKADAAFIAAARSDVPALVAEVRRLRDRLYRAQLDLGAIGELTWADRPYDWRLDQIRDIAEGNA